LPSIGTEGLQHAGASREDSVKAQDLPEPETPVNQAIARQFQVNILQVVLPSSPNANGILTALVGAAKMMPV